MVKKEKQIIGLGGCDSFLCRFKMYTASGAVGSEPSLIYFFVSTQFIFSRLRLANSQLAKYVNTEVIIKSIIFSRYTFCCP